MKAVRNTIPAIAETMENIHQKITISFYQLILIRLRQKKYTDYLSEANTEIERYNGLEDKIYDAFNERETLLAEKKNTLFLNFSKYRKLDTRIAELTELLDKLHSEKYALLKYLDCADDDGISKVKKDIADTEAGLKKLNEQEERYSSKLDAALKEYAERGQSLIRRNCMKRGRQYVLARSSLLNISCGKLTVRNIALLPCLNAGRRLHGC